MTILLTGGTGTLGSLVVPLLRDAGHDVRVLSRRGGRPGVVTGDLLSGEGVDAAVAGVTTIVHCAGDGRHDETTTRTLVRAATRAGRPHLVFISVVGADRIPANTRLFAYYAAKGAAERIIAESGLPWTTLRATQFHDLILTAASYLAKLPVIPLPAGFRFQPVDTAEVAARLAELAVGEPAGLVDDIAGPRVYATADLLRGYLRSTGRRRPIIGVRLPGRAARAFRDGANLAPQRAVGRRTWEEFLADREAAAQSGATMPQTPADKGSGGAVAGQ